MMRFRCPHCQQVLEVVKPTEMLLCPACELWCRLPIPDEFELSHEEGRPAARPKAITAQRPEELPLRLRDEPEEVEDVKFDVIEDGGERRRKRRRRRRRRHSRAGFDLDYWISPSLILLVLLVPGGIFVIVLSFFLHPGAGLGAVLMVGGSIWFIFIAAEDGLATALMVLFVPFYPWYFAFTNFERVAAPFALRCLGAIIFAVSLVAAHISPGG